MVDASKKCYSMTADRELGVAIKNRVGVLKSLGYLKGNGVSAYLRYLVDRDLANAQVLDAVKIAGE